MNERYRDLVNSIGKIGAHTLYPNDFEYYMLSLELVDISDQIIEYFVFPVFANSIRVNDTPLSKIKNTLDGVVSLSRGGFVPRDITISGSFGKKLRLMIGKIPTNFVSLRYSSNNGIFDTIKGISQNLIKNIPFDTQIKTGYGSVKVLQSIIRKSNDVDDNNQPFRLNFYNLSLNENYLVKVVNFEVTQSFEENMIWKYTLNLKAIAQVYQEKNNREKVKSLAQLVSSSAITNMINKRINLSRGFLKIWS